jgi:hypothetical protein
VNVLPALIAGLAEIFWPSRLSALALEVTLVNASGLTAKLSVEREVGLLALLSVTWQRIFF